MRIWIVTALVGVFVFAAPILTSLGTIPAIGQKTRNETVFLKTAPDGTWPFEATIVEPSATRPSV